MNDNPKVSIIIPVYNGEKYLKEAIDSALTQTYKNLEIIVVNDGSTDNTEKIAKSYGNKIRYYKKENGGVSTALNLGIKKMKGEYFSWLSHDDFYKPTKIEKQINILKQLDDKQTVILCNTVITDSKLNPIKKTCLPPEINTITRSFLALRLIEGINGCTLLIHKALLEKYGPFNEDLFVTQDYDMWYRIATHKHFYLLDETLVYYRTHQKQSSKTIAHTSLELDNLHNRLISNLTPKEYETYKNITKNTKLNIESTFKSFIYSLRAFDSALAILNKEIELYPTDSLINKLVSKNISKKQLDDFIKHKKNKKTILIFNDYYIIGGLERSISTTINTLSDKYNIIFVAKNFVHDKSYVFNKKVTTFNLNEQCDEQLICSVLFLCSYLKIDLFIGTQNINSETLQIYQQLAKLGIPTISSNHYDYTLVCQVFEAIPILNYRDDAYRNNLVSVWKNTRSATIAEKKYHNAFYIPNPLPFSRRNKIKPFGTELLTIGRLNDKYKRLDLALLCFNKIHQQNPKAHLTIVGKIDKNTTYDSLDNKKISEYIKSNHLESAVTFTGEVKDVLQYYKKADILLVTSETEGFGMTIIEAASQGVPTVAFDISSLNDLIIDGHNGFLVQDKNTINYINKTLKLLNSPSLQQSMKQNALLNSAKFEKAAIIKQWDYILDSILNHPKDKIKPNFSTSNLNYIRIIQEYETALLKLNNEKEQLLKFIPPPLDPNLPFYRKALRYYHMHGIRQTLKTTINRIIKH